MLNKKPISICFILIFSAFFNLLFAQEKIKLPTHYRICAVAGDPETEVLVYNRVDPKIQAMFDEICQSQQIPTSFFKISEAKVPNLQVNLDKEGYKCIYYSRNYWNEIKTKTKTELAMYFALAHEIGHHMGDHLRHSGDTAKSRNEELEADKFAGCALAHKTGIDQDMLERILTILSEKGDATHPSRAERQDSIMKGFQCLDKITNDCVRNNTGSIGFRNSNKSKIRISKMIDNIHIDTITTTIILPNTSKKIEKLSAVETTFYIEIWVGQNAWGDLWQPHPSPTKTDKVRQCNIEPSPIEIK